MSEYSGDGLSAREASVSLRDVVFKGNVARVRPGGAIYAIDQERGALRRHHLTLSGVGFEENESPEGGAVSLYHTRLTADSVVFVRNRATLYGGALYLLDVTALISNALFMGNQSEQVGGAMDIDGAVEPIFRETLDSVVVVNSTCAGIGGASFSIRGSLTTFRNSVFFGGRFTPDPPDFDHLEYRASREAAVEKNGSPDTRVTVQNSLLMGGMPSAVGWYGEGNLPFSTAPAFRDTLGADGVAWTGDEDLRPLSTSPLAYAGDPARLLPDPLDRDGDGDTTEPTPFELAGAPRLTLVNGVPRVSIGAYEPGPAVAVAPEMPTFGTMRVWPSPARGAFTVRLPEAVPADVSVYDALGRTVANVQGASGVLRIGAAGWAAGVYVVVARIGARTHTARLVVAP